MLGSRGSHTEIYWRYQCRRLIHLYDNISPKNLKLTYEERLRMFDRIDALDIKEARKCKYELEKRLHDVISDIRKKQRTGGGEIICIKK